jgi:hypothetical protein
MNNTSDVAETITLFFMDIISVCFNEDGKQSSTLINSALVTNNDGVVVFDFFPLVNGGGKLKEDEDSDFKIKCKKIDYNVIG